MIYKYNIFHKRNWIRIIIPVSNRENLVFEFIFIFIVYQKRKTWNLKENPHEIQSIYTWYITHIVYLLDLLLWRCILLRLYSIWWKILCIFRAYFQWEIINIRAVNESTHSLFLSFSLIFSSRKINSHFESEH